MRVGIVGDVIMEEDQRWIRIVIIVAIIAAAGAIYCKYSEELNLERLADRESILRQFLESHPVLASCAAFSVYVLVTGLSLPGALVLSLTYAWLFGFWRSLLIVSFASTTGATIAFLLSRFLFRDWVRNRFSGRLSDFEKHWDADGPFYLLTLRLVPAVPFFIVNLMMGLTPIRTRTYWWVSQIGMLPGSIVYLYAGSTVPSLSVLSKRGTAGILSVELLIGLSLLGASPWLIRWLVRRLKRQKM